MCDFLSTLIASNVTHKMLFGTFTDYAADIFEIVMQTFVMKILKSILTSLFTRTVLCKSHRHGQI